MKLCKRKRLFQKYSVKAANTMENVWVDDLIILKLQILEVIKMISWRWCY